MNSLGLVIFGFNTDGLVILGGLLEEGNLLRWNVWNDLRFDWLVFNWKLYEDNFLFIWALLKVLHCLIYLLSCPYFYLFDNLDFLDDFDFLDDLNLLGNINFLDNLDWNFHQSLYINFLNYWNWHFLNNFNQHFFHNLKRHFLDDLYLFDYFN